MTTEIANGQNLPRDAKTGLTLPLSASLDSQDLAKHRAMVAVELEVLAKKYDRFGWDRDMNTPAQDRLITDWMDALQDYPLSEIQAACREWVRHSPRKMPNEGDIHGEVQKARAKQWQARKAKLPREEDSNVQTISAQRSKEIMEELGIKLDANGFVVRL